MFYADSVLGGDYHYGCAAVSVWASVVGAVVFTYK